MQYRCLEVNGREHLRGRVQFSAGRGKVRTVHTEHPGADGCNTRVTQKSFDGHFVMVEWTLTATDDKAALMTPPCYDKAAGAMAHE